MSVKISDRPRTGEGLSIQPTTEIIVDFETTGIDLDTLLVIEAGVIGVDDDLGDTFFIDTMVEHGTPQEALAQIAADPFLVNMHTENGIVDDLERMISGDCVGMTLATLEQSILDRLPETGKVALGGSGVSHFEREIIRLHMPTLHERLYPFPDDVGIERRSYRRANKRNLVSVIESKTHRGLGDAQVHLAEIRAFHTYHKRAAALILADDAKNEASRP